MKKIVTVLVALIATSVQAQTQPRFVWMGVNYAYDNLLHEKVDIGSAKTFQEVYSNNGYKTATDAFDKDRRCRPAHLFIMGYLDCYGRQVRAFPWWCHYIPEVSYVPVQTTGTTNTTTTTGTGAKLEATCYFIQVSTHDTITMNGTVQGGVFSPETMKSGDLWASVRAGVGIFKNLSFCGGYVTISNGSRKWYPAISKEKGGYWICNNYPYLKKDFLPSPEQTEGVFHSVAQN